MSKWTKKSNNDPWETRKDDLTGTEPKSGWKHMLGGVVLCAMVLLAGWTAWTAMNGGFKNDADLILAEGAELAEKDIAADPAIQSDARSGGSNIEDDGAGMRNIPDAESLSTESLMLFGVRPSVKILRNAEVPYVFYDIGEQNSCGSLSLKDTFFKKVTDEDVPEAVYADITLTKRYLEYSGNLYVVSGEGFKEVNLWINDIIDVASAGQLKQAGKAPTLEQLQRASILSVYDKNGEQIALFDSSEPSNPKLPDVVYVDEICSGRYLDYCGALYILFDSGNYTKVTIPNRAVYDTIVTLADGTRHNTADDVN